MFGNLKNKIGDVADLKKYTSPQMLINSLGSSRQRSAQHTPGSQTPKSSHSREHSQSSAAFAPIQLQEKRTSQDANELEREISKLKSNLEAQQDSALNKLEAKEVEWKKKLQDALKRTSALEKELLSATQREKNLQTKYREKDRLQNETSAELIVSKEKYKDIEKRLFELQDNYDQMEGLSTQEGAKVKHLLLNASSEAESLKGELSKKKEEIDALQSKLVTYSGLEERVSIFNEEKMEFETKLAGLQQKLNISTQKLTSQEKSHSDEIEHLQDKINSLESRSKHHSLEESEKVKSLIQERDILDHKLEESRQQLTNIKTSWSEKISSLETQIQNLNEKISEDQMDLKTSEETIAKLRGDLQQSENSHLSEAQRAKDEICRLQNQVGTLEEDFESQKWHTEELLSKKDKEIKDLRRLLHQEESKFGQSQEDLQLKEKELMQLRSDFEVSEEELKKLKKGHGILQDDFSHLVSSTSSLQDSFNAERRQRDILQTELEAIQSKLEATLAEKTKLSANLDIFLLKVESYEEELKRLKSESTEKDSSFRSLEDELATATQRADEASHKLVALEEQFDAKVEQSDLVKRLKEEIKSLEDDISDKKQMLKVQGQRLADMKKTVQKELKINPNMLDSSEPSKNISPRNSNSEYFNTKTHTAMDHPVFLEQIPLNYSMNGEVEIDRINLEYLKHVVLKFITLRDYEAVQLTKALATLLHMSPREEAILKETLESKMSWFGARPNLPSGQ